MCFLVSVCLWLCFSRARGSFFVFVLDVKKIMAARTPGSVLCLVPGEVCLLSPLFLSNCNPKAKAVRE